MQDKQILRYDVCIIGAGAAGLMCAIEAGKRGRKTLVIEHAKKPGKKILMSGGGRCNFTNLEVSHENFISKNPHFCKSALSRYSPESFITMVEKHNIPFYEKTLGQLFCKNKSKDILNMLLSECADNAVKIALPQSVSRIKRHEDNGFLLSSTMGPIACQSLVIATGGLSIPTMGSSPFGYEVAKSFAMHVWPTSAGLVPFTLQPKDLDYIAPLSGIANECAVTCQNQSFTESMLFTHRGLSGPAMLQISSYWTPGQSLEIKLLPELDLLSELKSARKNEPGLMINTILQRYFSKQHLAYWFDNQVLQSRIANCNNQRLSDIAAALQAWKIIPNATEGYRTAEVTLGGVDCSQLSSKTMMSKVVPNLYFIGEVCDVTGWLGGYNFQWAWSSGYAAGQVV